MSALNPQWLRCLVFQLADRLPSSVSFSRHMVFILGTRLFAMGPFFFPAVGQENRFFSWPYDENRRTTKIKCGCPARACSSLNRRWWLGAGGPGIILRILLSVRGVDVNKRITSGRLINYSAFDLSMLGYNGLHDGDGLSFKLTKCAPLI